MKNGIFVVMMVAALLMAWGCNSRIDTVTLGASGVDSLAAEAESMGYDSERVTQGSWMELFMGMGQHMVPGNDGDSTYSYDCTLPEFEGLDDIASQELEATWYNNDGEFSSKFRCTMGLYVDKEFPSQEVFRQVELGLDTLLTQSFYCYDELERVMKSLAQRKGYAPRKDIQQRFKQAFDQFTQVMSARQPANSYARYPEARVCYVAHKIYDKGDWASYIIEFSFSYNGSNGCPSWADYITVNKKTGHRLTADDVVKRYGAKDVAKKLREAFLLAKQQRNADMEVQNYNGEELIELVDGCAIVDEGVMFYYRPYNIGCGAEGEYNLVLDNVLKDPTQ